MSSTLRSSLSALGVSAGGAAGIAADEEDEPAPPRFASPERRWSPSCCTASYAAFMDFFCCSGANEYPAPYFSSALSLLTSASVSRRPRAFDCCSGSESESLMLSARLSASRLRGLFVLFADGRTGCLRGFRLSAGCLSAANRQKQFCKNPLLKRRLFCVDLHGSGPPACSVRVPGRVVGCRGRVATTARRSVRRRYAVNQYACGGPGRVALGAAVSPEKTFFLVSARRVKRRRSTLLLGASDAWWRGTPPLVRLTLRETPRLSLDTLHLSR